MVDIILLLISIGVIVGILSGFFGIGGGVVSVPLFVIVFRHIGLFTGETAMHYAEGTTLAMMVFTATMSYKKHHKNENIMWDVVKKLALYTAIGSIIGGLCSTFFSGRIIEHVFALYLFCMGIYVLYSLRNSKEKKIKNASSIFWIILGIVVGFKSGLLGIGGGTVIIPILIAMNYPIKKVAGTTSVITLIVSIVGTTIYCIMGVIAQGWFSNYSIGYIFLPAMICVTPFSIFFAKLGVNWNKKFSAKNLKILFGLLLLILCINMVL